MTKRRIAKEPRKFWTPAEDARLRAEYPNRATKDLVPEFPGRTLGALNQRAITLGLAKSEAHLASPAACRLRRGDQVGRATQFAKGQTPANKGLRRPGWGPGRMKETQFRKGSLSGRAAQIVKPIGAERMSRDGYLERKISNERPFQRRWRAVHLLVWEQANGPLPPGHAVSFKNGDKLDIRLENLELIPRSQLMRRNTIHNYPPELTQVIQLRAALTRKINRRASA